MKLSNERQKAAHDVVVRDSCSPRPDLATQLTCMFAVHWCMQNNYMGASISQRVCAVDCGDRKELAIHLTFQLDPSFLLTTTHTLRQPYGPY